MGGEEVGGGEFAAQENALANAENALQRASQSSK
jgi:hypothetical protein